MNIVSSVWKNLPSFRRKTPVAPPATAPAAPSVATPSPVAITPADSAESVEPDDVDNAVGCPFTDVEEQLDELLIDLPDTATSSPAPETAEYHISAQSSSSKKYQVSGDDKCQVNGSIIDFANDLEAGHVTLPTNIQSIKFFPKDLSDEDLPKVADALKTISDTISVQLGKQGRASGDLVALEIDMTDVKSCIKLFQQAPYLLGTREAAKVLNARAQSNRIPTTFRSEILDKVAGDIEGLTAPDDIAMFVPGTINNDESGTSRDLYGEVITELTKGSSAATIAQGNNLIKTIEGKLVEAQVDGDESDVVLVAPSADRSDDHPTEEVTTSPAADSAGTAMTTEKLIETLKGDPTILDRSDNVLKQLQDLLIGRMSFSTRVKLGNILRDWLDRAKQNQGDLPSIKTLESIVAQLPDGNQFAETRRTLTDTIDLLVAKNKSPKPAARQVEPEPPMNKVDSSRSKGEEAPDFLEEMEDVDFGDETIGDETTAETGNPSFSEPSDSGISLELGAQESPVTTDDDSLDPKDIERLLDELADDFPSASST